MEQSSEPSTISMNRSRIMEKPNNETSRLDRWIPETAVIGCRNQMPTLSVIDSLQKRDIAVSQNLRTSTGRCSRALLFLPFQLTERDYMDLADAAHELEGTISFQQETKAWRLRIVVVQLVPKECRFDACFPPSIFKPYSRLERIRRVSLFTSSGWQKLLNDSDNDELTALQLLDDWTRNSFQHIYESQGPPLLELAQLVSRADSNRGRYTLLSEALFSDSWHGHDALGRMIARYLFDEPPSQLVNQIST